eukprot:2854211-Pyramimonas_sp.AAC.1
MRFQARERLAKADSIALYQDGSGARLLMRYSISDRHMNVFKGVLGVGDQVEEGGGAEGIARTTDRIQ